MTPPCFNRPEFGPYETAYGEIVEHRMSQPCKSWSTGDRATPVPVLENWNCAGCQWASLHLQSKRLDQREKFRIRLEETGDELKRRKSQRQTPK